MDSAYQGSGLLPGGRGGPDAAGFLALALWLGGQRDELSAALAALRQAGNLHWDSAAGNAYRMALEERRRSLLRAGEALEAARAALALHASLADSPPRVRGMAAVQAVPGDGGLGAGSTPSVHYEGR
ncbi:hypothetical protein [Arthrobacter sp. RCC_34]|uniref:hypothetical protein n=1 Tax=Arthrobacter sp. RCC_34 TaxID=3239230 RepID=UPI0035245700